MVSDQIAIRVSPRISSNEFKLRGGACSIRPLADKYGFLGPWSRVIIDQESAVTSPTRPALSINHRRPRHQHNYVLGAARRAHARPPPRPDFFVGQSGVDWIRMKMRFCCGGFDADESPSMERPMESVRLSLMVVFLNVRNRWII